MCGICGVIDWSDSPDAAGLVRRMTPTMFHRGPDDEGYFEMRIADGGLRNSSLGSEGLSDFGISSSALVGSLALGMRGAFRRHVCDCGLGSAKGQRAKSKGGRAKSRSQKSEVRSQKSRRSDL